SASSRCGGASGSVSHAATVSEPRRQRATRSRDRWTERSEADGWPTPLPSDLGLTGFGAGSVPHRCGARVGGFARSLGQVQPPLGELEQADSVFGCTCPVQQLYSLRYVLPILFLFGHGVEFPISRKTCLTSPKFRTH